MNIHFTARRFKAHSEVRDHAIAEMKKLDRYYDGIVRGNIILSYERPTNSIKIAELNLHVHGTVLSAREQSGEFLKSIDLAIGKLERQLSKYKTKINKKDRKTLRRVKSRPAGGKDED